MKHRGQERLLLLCSLLTCYFSSVSPWPSPVCPTRWDCAPNKCPGHSTGVGIRHWQPLTPSNPLSLWLALLIKVTDGISGLKNVCTFGFLAGPCGAYSIHFINNNLWRDKWDGSYCHLRGDDFMIICDMSYRRPMNLSKTRKDTFMFV